MANQVDFKILPSDQFSVHSPATRSEKIITYFTLLSKLRGDILAVSSQDDPNDIVSAYYSNVGGTQTLHLVKADGSEVTASNTYAGTVTSVDMSVPTGFAISGNPITTSGTLNVSFASGYSLPTNALQATWTTAYNRSITSAAVTGTSTKTLTLNQQDGGTITASWTDIDTGLTSVGLTMPSAFSVANSPLTTNGTIAVTGAGTAAQYVRGDGQLANFPASGGGGSTINYYLNGSVNQGTFGGTTYYEMSKTPVAGAGTNFTRTSAQGAGYIASFITDAGDPALLNIPGGNWNLEIYFSASSSGGGPSFYGEVYKVDSSNVFTLIASNSASPEGITNGTTLDQYFTSIAVPQTTLLVTDRLAVRIYVNPDGRNITMHTEDNNFCEVITTFSTGLNALNGLTAQVQYFATGTSGTDFNIDSVTDTHTFNLPTASATNRGALSSSDWTTFNSKASDAFKTIAVAGQSNVVADSATDTLTFEAGSNIVITTDAATDKITISAVGGGTGSVTSVDMTVPTGFAISGNPITSSGTLALAFASGYSLPTNASQTNWNTAYDNSITAFAYNTSTGVLTLTQQDAGTLSASVTLQPFTTTNLAEGTNLYFTTSRARQVLSAGTGISYDNSTGVITNSAPDQIVSLSAGTGISTSGTYPNFTITNSDRGSSQNIFKNIAVSGQSTIVADGNDDTLTVAAGTGITLATNATSDTLTITNSLPDQTVVLTAGTGISVSGTYPSFTIANTGPTGSGTTNYVTKWTGTSVIGNSQIFDNGTNVGIGTATPAEKLQVNGLVRITNSTFAGIEYHNTNGTWELYVGTENGGGGARYNSASSQHTFYNNGSAIMRINSSGNVGIGTTSPSSKLHVAGTVSADAAFADSGAYRILKPNGGVRTSTSGTETGAIKITYPVGYTNTMHRVKLNVYEYVTNQSFTIYFGGYPYAPGTQWYNEFAYILNNSAINRNFTVRFGYDGTKLVVYIGELSSTWSYPQFFIEEVELGYSGMSDTWRDGSWSIGLEASAFQGVNATVSNTQATNWGRSGNNTYYSFGNVGIGTTAPTTNLHVQGTNTEQVLISYDSTKRMLLGRTSGYGWIAPYTDGVSYDNLVLARDGGNVGIGTISPSYKLHVAGTSYFTAEQTILYTDAIQTMNGGSGFGLFRIYGNSNAVELQVDAHSSNSGAATIGTYSNSDVYIKTNNSNKVVVKAGGNVGIGTTSPGQKLDVVGTIKAGIAGNSSANIPALLVTSSGTGDEQAAIAIQQATSEGDTIIFADYEPYVEWGISTENAGNKIQFTAGTSTGSLGSKTLYNNAGTARTAYIKFDHDLTSGQTLIGGNVGIGTTSPQSKLDVVGVIRYGNNAASIGALSYGSAGIVTLEGVSTNTSIGILPSGTGKVGINTIAPDTMLHVVGDIKVTGGYYDSSGDIGSAGQFLKSTGTGTNWTTVNVIDGSGTANYVAKWSDSDTITNSIIFDNGTDVGIGTATPGSKLDILSSANPFVTVRTTSYAAVLGADTTNGYIKIGAGTNHAVGTVVNGTIRTWLDTDGNLSVGTTTAKGKLTVVSPISSTSPTLYIESSTSGSGLYGMIAAGDSFHGLVMRGKPAANGTFEVTAGDEMSFFEYGGIFNFYQKGPSFSLFSRIANGAATYFNGGNVGIGTTGPSGLLHVNKQTGVTSFTSSTFLQMVLSEPNSQGTEYVGIDFTGYSPSYTSKPLGRIAVIPTGAGTVMSFGTSNSYTTGITNQAMVINQSGNVGIGTTSPDAIFHVAKSASSGIGGQIVIDNPASSAVGNAVEISFLTDAGASGSGTRNARIIAENENAGNGAANMQFHTWSGAVSAERMRITSGGNVGIGTTSPSGKLSILVDGASTWSQYIQTPITTNKRNSIGFFDNVGANVASILTDVNNDNTADFGISVPNGSPRFVIKASGNIGIGETAPSTLVHLNKSNADSLITSTPSIIISNRNSTSGSFIGGGIFNNTYRDISSSSVTAGIYFLNKNSAGAGALAKVSDIIFATGGYSTDWVVPDEKMRLTTDGYLGIGTSAPTSLLHIATSSPPASSGAVVNIRDNNASGSNTSFAGIFFNSAPGTDYSVGKLSVNGNGYFQIRNGNNGTGILTADNSGNVGIGTTTPASKLDIGGGNNIWIRTPSAIQGLQFGYSDPSHGSYRAAVMGGPESYGGTDSGMLTFHTQNGYVVSSTPPERMRITSGGNVGIGTTSPTAKLTIGTNVSVQSTNGIALGVDQSSLEFVHATFQNGFGSKFYSVDSGNGITSLRLATRANSTSWGDAITVIAGTTGNGNVGINTTSPSTKLEVAGDAEIITIRTSYPANSSQRGAILWKDAANITGAIDTRYDGSTVDMHFGSLYSSGYNSTTRLIIKGNGNVGIGQTSPGLKLEVVGASNNWASRFSSNNGADAFFAHGGGYGAYINAGSSASSSTYILELISNGSTRMFVRGDGNVGIGTTSPGAILDVKASASSYNNKIATFQDTYTGSALDIKSQYSATPGSYAHMGIQAYFPGTSPMIYNNIVINGLGGNVGIGILSPDQILHINGPMRIDSALGSDPPNTTGTPRVGIGDVESDIYLADPAVWLTIYLNGTEYVIPAYYPN